MRRTLLGFFAGVGVTTALSLWLNSSPEETAEPDFTTETIADRPARKDNPSTEAGSVPNATPQAPLAETAEALALARSSDSAVNDANASEADLREQFDRAMRAAGQASYELEVFGLAKLLADRPIVSPTPLRPEFDWLQDAALHAQYFHEEFQREVVDSAWASSTESKITSLIYGQPEVIQEYGAPTVRCHTSMCEVTFFSYSDSGVSEDVRALYQALLDVPDAFDCDRQPAVEACWSLGNNEDGVTTIFWGLRKNEEQTQAVAATLGEIE